MNPIIERVFDAIVRIDSNLKVKFVSDSGLRWFGGMAPILSTSFLDFIEFDDHQVLQDCMLSMPPHFNCYVRVIIDGDKPVWASLRATHYPVVNQYLICILDINDHNNANPALVFAAEHDSLTRLPNRAKLTKTVEAYIHSGKLSFTVALLDLDGFKKVNDTLGHHAGDVVLIETAERLLKAVDRNVDLVARLGGDEFVLILDNANDDDRVSSIMSKILYYIARPFQTDEQDAYLGCSVGLAHYPEHGDTYSGLLKNADIAMYTSKRNGKNQISTYVHGVETEDFSIKSAIHIGIQEGEFFIEYQPQYDSNRQIKGAEALMRWDSRVLGKVPPAQFIAIAEETGLMTYLGEWILRAACQQLKSFQKHDPDFIISVNVSPVQFAKDDIYETILNTLEETGIDPKTLLLEITESTLLENRDKLERVLLDLNKRGVRFAIDDFGVGFSSLSYLTKFPITCIKIDKSFITAIEHQPPEAITLEKKLIKAMVSLAHSIDLYCVAEGVETEEQFNFLKTADCDFLQGYLLRRPVTPEEIITLIKGSK